MGKDPATLLALDTGPGVCLFDEAAQALGLTPEAATDLAEKGEVDRKALSAWLAHPYFAKPLPKTTGREIWRLNNLHPLPQEPTILLKTLLAFTAESALLAYERFVGSVDRVPLAGGGARNRVLVGLLAEKLPVVLLPNTKVRESLAFALLAYLHAQDQVNVLGRATGGRDIQAGMRVEPG